MEHIPKNETSGTLEKKIKKVFIESFCKATGEYPQNQLVVLNKFEIIANFLNESEKPSEEELMYVFNIDNYKYEDYELLRANTLKIYNAFKKSTNLEIPDSILKETTMDNYKDGALFHTLRNFLEICNTALNDLRKDTDASLEEIKGILKEALAKKTTVARELKEYRSCLTESPQFSIDSHQKIQEIASKIKEKFTQELEIELETIKDKMDTSVQNKNILLKQKIYRYLINELTTHK